MFPQGSYTRPYQTFPMELTPYAALINNIPATTIYSSSTGDFQSFIHDGTMRAMYFLIQWLNKASPKSIMFTHNIKGYTNADIEFMKDEENHTRFNQQLNALEKMGSSGQVVWNQAIFRINFTHINKNAQAFFKLADDLKSDLKTVSLGLQQNKNHKIRVYATDEKTYTIITSEFSWELVRQIVALYPKLFQDMAIPGELIPIFRALGNHNYEEWIQLWLKWAESTNLLLDLKRKDIQDIWSRIADRRTSLYKRNIEQNRNNIRSYEQEIAGYYQKIYKDEALLYAATTRNNESMEEVTNMLITNKYISNVRRMDNNMLLTIDCPLVHYDVEILKSYFKKIENITANETMQALLKEAFLEDKFTIWTSTIVQLDLVNVNVDRYQESRSSMKHLLNPHLMNYNCWGTNKSYIISAIKDNDLIVAITQIIAACQNLNFADMTVFRNFFTELKDNDPSKLCIQDNTTSKFYSFYTFQKLLEERKKANESNQSEPSPTGTNNGEVQSTPAVDEIHELEDLF